MPVDKFGRNGDRATPVYTGINITNLKNTFLRRDGGNTAIEAIDMNSNVSDVCIGSVVSDVSYIGCIKCIGSVDKSRCCHHELCRHQRIY